MSSTARPDAGPGLRIGVIAGTPVYLGRSWPLIVLLVLLIVVPAQSGAGGSLGQSLVVAVAFALMLLVSVLVHEAAHALVALWRGHRVDRIVADVWGGHTVYDATSGTPVSTALVAVAGPLSNLALAAVSWLVQPYVSGAVVQAVLEAVTYTNLFVGLYNLLPGLPLDGGQIVSSLVWRATGRKGTAAAGTHADAHRPRVDGDDRVLPLARGLGRDPLGRDPRRHGRAGHGGAPPGRARPGRDQPR